MCGLYDVGRCVCYMCCMCHVCVLCDVRVLNGSNMCGMNLCVCVIQVVSM